MSTLRIASLVPFATEIVIALGLEENLVAVSHDTILRESLGDIPVVTAQTAYPPMETVTDEDGETYEIPPSAQEIDAAIHAAAERGERPVTVNIDKLRELAPTLILTSKTVGLPAILSAAMPSRPLDFGDSVTVLDLSPVNLSQTMNVIRTVGDATGRTEEAEDIISETIARWEAAQQDAASSPNRPRTLLLQYPEPLVGAGFWIPELLSLANAAIAPWDVAGQPAQTLHWDDVLKFAPEVILLVVNSFDAERSAWEATTLSDLPGWFDLPAVKSGDCYAIDGNLYLVHPGPALAESAEILATILHPDTTQNTVPPYSVSRFPNEAMSQKKDG